MSQFEWTSYSEQLILLRVYLNYLNGLFVRIFTDIQPAGIPHLSPKSNMFTEAAWFGYEQAAIAAWTFGPHSTALHANISADPSPTFVNLTAETVYPRGMFLNSPQTSVSNVVAWGYFRDDHEPVEIPAGKTFAPQITCLLKSQFILGIEE